MGMISSMSEIKGEGHFGAAVSAPNRRHRNVSDPEIKVSFLKISLCKVDIGYCSLKLIS